MNGGYKMISLKNHDFATTGDDPVLIPGIYDAIEGSYRKPIILGDIIIEHVERPDRYAVFGVAGDNLVAVIALSDDLEALKCTVTPEDMVSFSTM